MQNIICVDLGSSHISTGIMLEDGELISVVNKEIDFCRNTDGLVEYNPEKIWKLVLSCVMGSVSRLQTKYRQDINTISISSMGEVGFPVTKDGIPLTTAIGWMDRRAKDQARVIGSDIGSKELFDITGMPLDSMYSINKILWLKDNQKEIFNSMYKWICMTDYINFKLTGSFITDYTIASRTMLFDIKRKKWSDRLLDYIGIEQSQLSDPCMTGTMIGYMKKEVKEDIGLIKKVSVILGGHDRSCIAAAMGVDNKNEIVDSTGIGEGLISIKEDPDIPPNIKSSNRFSCYPCFLDGKYIILGHFGSVGRLLDWIADKFNINSFISNNDLESPIYIPNTFSNNNYLEQTTWFGLTPQTTPEEITYSIYEGISFNFRQVLDLYCKEYSVKQYSLYMTGGMIKNNSFTQLKANALNHPVQIDYDNVATLIGVGKIASLGAGITKSWEEIKKSILPKLQTVNPQVEVKNYFSQRYQKYMEHTNGLNKRSNDAIY